jgi:hypothetical protein
VDRPVRGNAVGGRRPFGEVLEEGRRKYDWTVPNLTVNGPGEAPGNVVILDRDMTAREKADICGTSSVVVTKRRMDLRGARTSTPAR